MDIVKKLVFVAGGGRFGSYAVKYCRDVGMAIIVADVNKSCRASRYVDKIVENISIPREGDAYLVIGDAPRVLLNMYRLGIVPDIVIPTVPGHLMGKFFKFYLEEKGFGVYPDIESLEKIILSGLLNDVIIDIDRVNAVIVASYMPKGMFCITPCPEPDICPVTGRIKKIPMYKLLDMAMKITSYTITLESKQIASGIGGIEGKDIVKYIERLTTEQPQRIAITTACKCHAIANLMYLKTKTQ